MNMNINCIGPIYYRFRKGEMFFELWFGVPLFELTLSVIFIYWGEWNNFYSFVKWGSAILCWFLIFTIFYYLLSILLFLFNIFLFSYLFFQFPFFLFPIYYSFFYFLFFFLFLFFLFFFCSRFSIFTFSLFFFRLLFNTHCFFFAICESFRTFMAISPPPTPPT